MEKGEVREKGWSAAVLCGLDRLADTLSGTRCQVRGKRHSSRLHNTPGSCFLPLQRLFNGLLATQAGNRQSKRYDSGQ
jgi:hypothetical protein